MIWNFALNAANFNAGIAKMRGSFNGMFDDMSSGITKNISKFNAYQVALDYCIAAGKKLINESKELIAISTKYDIPISKMGKLQVLANQSGQSVGQLARGFRFLEMNMGKALLKPGGPQDQALKELGVSQEDIVRAASDTAFAMELVREKVMRIGDEERRNAFLQEIYGANWQNMLVIIEANATALKDAESSGYKYSNSMTQSLTGVAATMEEIAQDIKPLIMPVVQVIAIIITVFGVLIEGLKLGVTLIGKGMVGGFKLVLAGIQAVVGGISKAIGMFYKLIGLTKLGGAVEGFGDDTLGAAKGNAKGFVDEYKGMEPHLVNSGREVSKSSDRIGRQFMALRESVGGADEDQYIKEKKEDMAEMDKAIMKNKTAIEQKIKAQVAAYKAEQMGIISKEEYMAGEEELRDLQIDQEKMAKDKIRIQEQLDRANAEKDKKKDDTTKPRTQEERKVELQRGRQARERAIAEQQALNPAGQQMETYFEVEKAKENIRKLEEDAYELAANNADDIQKRADMEHQIGMAKIALIEKERAHELFMRKQQREREDSERERKDAVIKAMEEREQIFMTRQGMTGMDKASVAVENAIQKMMRDQEQFDKVMNDKNRSQDEKLSVQKQLEGSTMSAMKEFDKLSMMQFQYSASDDAKKGFGGGIDVRENQLSVAKSSLDYLKKSYDLQLKLLGLSPDQFGNVPFQMSGPLRAGK